MRTFAELLREYSARTGVSDAELGRYLGVRRQTIFRWKEGLTERPRRREDVVRCAEKLRLTPEERDELLLAAGFAPERPMERSRPHPGPLPEGEGTHLEQGAPQASLLPLGEGQDEGVAQGRRSLVPTRLVLPAVILLGLAASLFLWSARWVDYPTAAAGELLVLVGPYEATPGPITAAIEREARAARLENVRVAAWPEPLADAAAATRARERAGALLALGGGREGGSTRVELSARPPAARQDDLSLDALVAHPAETTVTVDADSPDEAQAIATLAASRLLVERGEFDRARALLLRALAMPPRSPHAQAAFYLTAGYLAQLRPAPDHAQALGLYESSLRASDSWVARLNRGVAALRLGQPAAPPADLARAAELAPSQPIVRRALCWAYAAGGEPAAALPHCDAAVTAEPEGRSLEARAVARAGAGQLGEAAADLDRFLGWLDKQPASLRARHGSTRAAWRQALHEGRNPFDPPTLEAIRRE